MHTSLFDETSRGKLPIFCTSRRYTNTVAASGQLDIAYAGQGDAWTSCHLLREYRQRRWSVHSPTYKYVSAKEQLNGSTSHRTSDVLSVSNKLLRDTSALHLLATPITKLCKASFFAETLRSSCERKEWRGRLAHNASSSRMLGLWLAAKVRLM